MPSVRKSGERGPGVGAVEARVELLAPVRADRQTARLEQPGAALEGVVGAHPYVVAFENGIGDSE
jgi:hypothetical protein